MSWFSRIVVESSEKIAVIGLGFENQQFVQWLLESVKISPSRLVITDIKTPTDHNFIQLLAAYPEITTFFGEQYLACLQQPEIGWVFKTPGVWSKKPELEQFRQQKGADRVQSSLIFFLEACHSRIIAVTGTKGKTTTSSLIYHVLNSLHTSQPSQFPEVFYCGNSTNISPYTFWKEVSNPPQNPVFVIELSSFQLQDLDVARYSPHISVVTNYFIDHLNQHADVAEYWAAKDTILRYQSSNDIAIITDQIRSRTSIDLLYKNVIAIDALKAEHIINILLQAHLPLPGKHNEKNTAQAVYAVAAFLTEQQSDLQAIESTLAEFADVFKQSLETFQGVSHRLQLVHQTEASNIRIQFWDDGAATEPDAVAAAIHSLTEQAYPSWLVLHVAGLNKGGDTQELIELMNQSIASGKLYGWFGNGEIGSLFQPEVSIESINAPLLPFYDTVTKVYPQFLKDLIALAQTKNIQEINILFSPCGSSFDEFESYAHRSDWWSSQVKAIVF